MTNEIARVVPEEWSGDERAPWDRLDEESSLAFSRFAAYRDLGPGRTFKQIAEKLELNLETVRNHAGPHSWARRAQAYDEYLDRRVRLKLEKEILTERQTTAAIVRVARQKVVDAVMKMNPDDLSPRDMIVWLDTLTKLSRQAHGDIDTKRVELTGAGGGPIETVSSLDPAARAELMRQARAELDKRLGLVEIEGVIDADIVEEDDAE